MDESKICGVCGARLIGDRAPCPFGHERRVAADPGAVERPPQGGWGGQWDGSALGGSAPGGPWIGTDGGFGAATPLPAWVTSPVPPGSVPGPPKRGKRIGAVVKAGLTVLVVLAVGCGAMVFLGVRRVERTPPHPDEWDPRVADIAGWVEMERGLTFDEPVYVDFLTAAEYSEFTRTDDGDRGDGKDDDDEEEDPQASLDDLVGWYRALSLLEGDHDLEAAFADMYDSGTLALYDPSTERITVRGTEMTPEMEVTIAHELTHALQDQHFDLGRLDELTGVREEAFRAVAEGDADRIEQAYIDDELTTAERKVYDAETEASAGEAETALAETVPDIIQTGFGSAYVLGGGFIAVLDQAGGDEAINEALRDPPETDEQLFDPFAYLDHEKAVEVEAPTPRKGSEVLDQHELGATVLFVLLASRIDAQAALEAVDGWGGDVAVVSRRGDRVCIDLSVAGEDERDTARLGDALRRWSEATPGDHDQVSVTADAVVLAACDPGAQAALSVSPDVGRYLALPQFRSHVGASVMEDGGSRSEAECFARTITAEADVLRLVADDGYAQSMEYQQVLAAARRTCLE